MVQHTPNEDAWNALHNTRGYSRVALNNQPACRGKPVPKQSTTSPQDPMLTRNEKKRTHGANERINVNDPTLLLSSLAASAPHLCCVPHTHTLARSPLSLSLVHACCSRAHYDAAASRCPSDPHWSGSSITICEAQS